MADRYYADALMRKVRDSGKLTGTELTVMLLLILYVNPNTGWTCNPSQYELAFRTGHDRKTIRRAIYYLQAEGLIACADYGRGHAYQIQTAHIDALLKVSRPSTTGHPFEDDLAPYTADSRVDTARHGPRDIPGFGRVHGE